MTIMACGRGVLEGGKEKVKTWIVKRVESRMMDGFAVVSEHPRSGLM